MPSLFFLTSSKSLSDLLSLPSGWEYCLDALELMQGDPPQVLLLSIVGGIGAPPISHNNPNLGLTWSRLQQPWHLSLSNCPSVLFGRVVPFPFLHTISTQLSDSSKK